MAEQRSQLYITEVITDPVDQDSSSEAWTDGLLPQERILGNPLMTHRVIGTAPCREVYLECKRRMFEGRPGFVLLADAGMGGDSALDSIRSELIRDFPGMATKEIVLRRSTPCSQRQRWQFLLDEFGHRVLTGSPEAMRSRCLWMIEEQILRGQLMHFVLFVRNIELLDEDLANIFLDLGDSLRRKGFRLFLISCGSHHRFRYLIRGCELHVTEKFWSLLGFPYQLRPLNDLSDFASLLEEIDTPSIGADQGGWGSAFFPQAYKNGFRMKDQASRILAAIAKGGAGMASTRVIFDAIRWVMSTQAGNDSPTFVLPDDIWESALLMARSGPLTPLLENTARSDNGK